MPRAKTAPKPAPKPVAPQLDLALLSEWQPVAGVVSAVLASNADAALTGLRALPPALQGPMAALVPLLHLGGMLTASGPLFVRKIVGAATAVALLAFGLT